MTATPAPPQRHGHSHCLQAGLLLFWVALLGFFFAKVEIQIEGGAGWAQSLPTWRVEGHPLLDLFWGGRPMTGYHAWVFSFMLLVFHLPVFILHQLDWHHELRILGSLMLFWIIEDFLWFVLNPAFGLAKFVPAHIPWHKRWLLGMPTDYVAFLVIGFILIGLSYSMRKGKPASDNSQSNGGNP